MSRSANHEGGRLVMRLFDLLVPLLGLAYLVLGGLYAAKGEWGELVVASIGVPVLLLVYVRLRSQWTTITRAGVWRASQENS